MAEFRQPTINETALDNIFTEVELGTELLDERIIEVAAQAAQLVQDIVELQDS